MNVVLIFSGLVASVGYRSVAGQYLPSDCNYGLSGILAVDYCYYANETTGLLMTCNTTNQLFWGLYNGADCSGNLIESRGAFTGASFWGFNCNSTYNCDAAVATAYLSEECGTGPWITWTTYFTNICMSYGSLSLINTCQDDETITQTYYYTPNCTGNYTTLTFDSSDFFLNDYCADID